MRRLRSDLRTPRGVRSPSHGISFTEILMASAIVVAAAAIVLQAVLMFAMFLATRSMRNQVTGLIAKIEPMTETGQQLLEEARTKFGEFSAKTTDILDLSRTQLGRVDEILSEATTRTRCSSSTARRRRSGRGERTIGSPSTGSWRRWP